MVYIAHLQEHNVVDERCISLSSHIINAQHIWNARIKGEGMPVKAWQTHSIEQLDPLNEAGFTESMRLMNTLSPVHEIDYGNTQGETFKNSIQDVMLHIANHGTYHRGQLAARLTEIGVPALPSDYIRYKREQ